MRTVGRDIMKLSPEIALVVVLAHSLVLFLFSSQEIEAILHTFGLPGIPLVPVSSSQAIIGAIIGIALLKGGRGVNYAILGRILVGWIVTPLFAGLLAYTGLNVMQNVFSAVVVGN
jgi:PiT family inorganic phosphate transporter